MTGITATDLSTETAASSWRDIVAKYQRSDVGRSVQQIATTLVPLAGVFFLMYLSLALPYWVTLLLAVPAGGLLVRTFVIMHDCAHGSFFPTRRANNIVGWITGVLTLTPFARWRHSHNLHHASSGDLDRRGDGDVHTLTVREYLELSRFGRLKYRLLRNPLVMLGLGPILIILRERFPVPGTNWFDRDGMSVLSTNLASITLLAAAAMWIGWGPALLIYLPSIYIAAMAGIWLFYVQHQFEDTYWKDHGDWSYATAAIRGSSYLKLPAVLQWFTGSIGLHHVHHLGPRIPNYRLECCHDENELFHGVTILTMAESARMLGLKLWCEDRQRLVSFRELRTTK